MLRDAENSPSFSLAPVQQNRKCIELWQHLSARRPRRDQKCCIRDLACTRLSLRTINDAPDAAKPGLAAALKNNGFLPNLVRLLANTPIALEAYQTLTAINARGKLSAGEREAVQITAAAIHGCGFSASRGTPPLPIRSSASAKTSSTRYATEIALPTPGSPRWPISPRLSSAAGATLRVMN